jgi:oxygen-independent coproporphyrinogen III oxidase
VKIKRIKKRSNSYRGALEPLIPRILEPFLDVSSLYIHIPFCVKKCVYCDFFSVPYDESLAKAYTDALCKELHLRSIGADCLKTVYIGGGTPSLLPDECFIRIFSCLRDHYQFSYDAEISVEVNPGTLNQAKVDLIRSLRINRVSLGVQSFNDDELKVLGRIHTSDDAVYCLDLIRNSGFDNFSVDLMYGIPGQSMDSLRKTIAEAVECMPTHISTYELTFEEGTSICNTMKKPEEDLILDMYNHAIDYLADHSYEQYEISNFARSGFQCVHNLNYWDRGGYIGAGAGAHSFVNGIRSSNVKDIYHYVERLNSNLIPEIESISISPEDTLKESLFLRLRKREGMNITEAKKLGLDIITSGKELLEEGYLEIKDGCLRITRNGISLTNAVIIRLFANLGL